MVRVCKHQNQKTECNSRYIERIFGSLKRLDDSLVYILSPIRAHSGNPIKWMNNYRWSLTSGNQHSRQVRGDARWPSVRRWKDGTHKRYKSDKGAFKRFDQAIIQINTNMQANSRFEEILHQIIVKIQIKMEGNPVVSELHHRQMNVRRHIRRFSGLPHDNLRCAVHCSSMDHAFFVGVQSCSITGSPSSGNQRFVFSLCVSGICLPSP